jgi:hypothetical protein
MARNPWTAAEDDILREIYRTRSLVSQMHRLPGRSFEGARMHAKRLGLADPAFNSWTPDEDEILRRAYANGTPIKVALRDLPGRQPRAAIARAQRIGLTGTFSGITGSSFSWVEQAVRSALEDGFPMTIRQLAEVTRASLPGINYTVRRLHGNGLYIEGWDRSGNSHAARWMLGTKRDAKRPARKRSADSCRQWRARQKLAVGGFNPFAIAMQQVAA